MGWRQSRCCWQVASRLECELRVSVLERGRPLPTHDEHGLRRPWAALLRAGATLGAFHLTLPHILPVYGAASSLLHLILPPREPQRTADILCAVAAVP
jgi:hypothetical protein